MKLAQFNLFFILTIGLLPHKISKDYGHQLIVWNVGQGQWVTYIKNNHCYHMDMGGEFAPMKEVVSRCKYRLNWIYISHADKDHINFYKRFINKVHHHCLVQPNKNFLKYTHLKKNKLPLCKHIQDSPINIIYKPKFKFTENKNILSKVFVIEGQVLNPGDSLNKNELYWARNQVLNSVSILILGHHGSLTSNSDFLINRLPNLKFCVVSARKKRYGHPHGRIRLKLKLNRTPVISTEQWSHITILL